MDCVELVSLRGFTAFLVLLVPCGRGVEDLCHARYGYRKGINFTQAVFRDQVSAAMRDDVWDYLQSDSIDRVGLIRWRLAVWERRSVWSKFHPFEVAMSFPVSRETITVYNDMFLQGPRAGGTSSSLPEPRLCGCRFSWLCRPALPEHHEQEVFSVSYQRREKGLCGQSQERVLAAFTKFRASHGRLESL